MHLPSFLKVIGLVACLEAVTPLHAQVTNLQYFEVGVLPTNGSVMISESTNAVFVTITNAAGFTNIDVRGDFGAQTNIAFLDDGQPPDVQATNGTFSALLITPYVTSPAPLRLDLTLGGEVAVGDPPPDPLPAPIVQSNRVTYLILPRPSNDKFTNAFRIPAAGAVLTGTNTFASLEPGEPIHAGVPTVAASVWWTWSPATHGNTLVDLAGSAFDGVLAVYRGTTISNLVELKSATNDVVNRLRAHLNFDATAGNTYRIAVCGYNTNAVGDLRLRVEPGALPDTNGPVVSIITPASESRVTQPLVQFRGTAKERIPNDSGVVRVFLQINNDTNQIVARGTTDWEAVLTLPVGTNLVLARAVDQAGNVGPPAAAVVRYVSPANDMFEDAIVLDDVGGIETLDNTYATREAGEPFHALNEGGHSAWFAWRAPQSGELYLSTGGSSFDTLLALYIGDSVGNLFAVSSNDEAFPGSGTSEIRQKVVAHQLYYIAVDGYGGASGPLILSYSFTSTQVYFSLDLGTPLGGTVSPAGGLFAEGEALLLLAQPARNFEFVRWEDPGGTLISTANPLRLVMNRNYTINARFRVKSYSDTFRSGNLSALAWRGAGQAAWAVALLDGQYAARSGAIGHNQTSSLILITNLYDGFGVFDLRTSTEAGWDRLEFYRNGQLLGQWSGETAWTTFTFPISAGTVALEWRYVKDANFSDGADAVFIDNVYLPLEKPEPPPTRPSLALDFLPNGQAQITLFGLPGVTYVLQTSPDLSRWSDFATNSAQGAALQWYDPNALTQPQRFYRARVP